MAESGSAPAASVGGSASLAWAAAVYDVFNDDDVLIATLQSGQIAAAGLDVYNNEPNVAPGLLALENVVLPSHLGSNTVETRDAMGYLVLDGIDAVLAGWTAGNLVG